MPNSSPPAPDSRAKRPAFVTGASSGIGAEFVRKLAARGHGIVMVGRRRERLDAVAHEVRQRYGVDVDLQSADLSDEEQLERLEKLIEERGPLDYLVNNAGFGTTGRFASIERAKQLAMLRVHVEASVRLTHAALPAMTKAGSGAIINVSSIAGFIRAPGNTLYCATKAFLNPFSESLALEVRRHGVRVQALCPGYTVTDFHDREDFADWRRDSVPRWMWMTASDVVDISLKNLARGEVVCVAGLRYRLLAVFLRSRLLFRVLRPFVRRRASTMDKDR